MQWHQLDHMQTICTSLQTTTPTPHHSVFTGQMLFLTANQQRQSTESTIKSSERTTYGFVLGHPKLHAPTEQLLDFAEYRHVRERDHLQCYASMVLLTKMTRSLPGHHSFNIHKPCSCRSTNVFLAFSCQKPDRICHGLLRTIHCTVFVAL